MKQLFANMALSVCVALGATNMAYAQSLSDLGRLLDGGKKEQTASSEDKAQAEKNSTTTSGNSTSGLGDLFNALSGGKSGQSTTTTPATDTKTENGSTTTGSSTTSGLGDLFNALSGGKSGQSTTTTPATDAKTENGSTTTGSSATSGLGDLFNALNGGKGGQTTTTATQTDKGTTTTGGSSTSGIGDILNALSGGSSSNGSSSNGDVMSTLGDILGNVIASNTELTVESLEGAWVYVAPACKFKSEDLLKSAGGDVVASQISKELAPTYTKLGFTSEAFGFNFENDGEFIMTYGKLPLPGEATKSEEKGFFNLEFVKLGTISIVTTPAYFEVVGDKMVVLFEADKFINMFRSVVNTLGITTLNTVFELVDSYDGVLIGFELNKQ